MKAIKEVFRKLKETIFNIHYWIAHRTYDQYHIVKLGFKPQYADVDYRMAIAIFVLLEQFVEQENGLEDYISYKTGRFSFEKNDSEYERYHKEIAPVYDKMHDAYRWWKQNKKEYFDNEFLFNEIKHTEMTTHLINIVQHRGVLWT